MKQSSKTKSELLTEISTLKKKIQKLEKSGAKPESAEPDLQESAFKTLFNSASEGILIADLKTKRFRYANPAVCRMFGYLEEEMLKLQVNDIHPEESLKKVLAEFDTMKRVKKNWALNIPCLRKNGSIFYANISETSIVVDGVKCNAGFFTDVTESKKAEERLSKSEKKFSSFFHMNLDPIAITDAARGTFIDVNEAFTYWTGYSREELIGFSTKDLHIWVNIADREKIVNTLRDSKSVLGEEILMRRKNGEIRNMIFSARYVEIDQDRYLLTIAHDITDRKKAEDALRVSEDKFRHLFESAGDSIFLLDNDVFIDCNPKALDMFGCTREQIIGQPPSRFSPEIQPDGKSSKEQALANNRAVLKGQPQYFEWRHCRYDGTRFDASISLTSFLDRGKPYILAICRDITENKHALEALHESEEKYRTLFENVREAIVVVQDRKAVFFNPMIAGVTGYSDKELSSRPFVDFIHADDREMVMDYHIRRLSGEDIPYKYTFRLLNKNGGFRWVELSAVKINWKGKPATLNFMIDITDRRRTEEEIQKANTLLNSIVENIPNMIFLKDARELRFTRFNRAGEELLGHFRGDLLGKNDYDLFPTEQADFFTEKDREVLRGKEILDIPEEFIQTRNRGERILHTKKVPILDTNGKPEYLMGISEDITDRKRAEEKEKETHALLRIAGEKSKLGGWSVNLQENRVTWSDEVAAIHEMPVGHSPMVEQGISFYAPEWQERITKVFTDCAQKGIPYDEEMEIITAGGKRVWVRTIGEAVKDDTGKIIKVQGAFQDISDRKKMELELRASEEKYKQLFDNAPAGIYRIDFKSGKFTKANDVFCDYAGCTQEEINTLGPFDILTEDSKKVFIERMDKMSRGISVPPTVELEVLNKKGLRLNVQLNVKNICDAEGHVVGADVVAHDITQQKQIENELRASESNFRNSFSDSPLGVRVSTIEGETIYANKAMLNIYGYDSVEELKNKTLRERYTPESYAEWQMRKEIRLQGKFGPSEYEISIVRKNGEIRHLQAFRKEIFWDGAVRYQVYYNDITERKHAEEEKRKLEERLNRVEKMEALGQLAGGVAHDLNNVLGILMGYAELLLMEIPEGERARSHAEKIMQSTERGAAIVQDLLTLARRGITKTEVIDLNRIVSGFINTPVFENIQGCHPQVNFKISCPDELLKIKGSPIHLEKTLMNLLLNAAEAITGKGEVTIRTENRYLEKPIMGYDEVKQGDYVVLTVSDTGTGILAENKEKIFEPFFTNKITGRSGTGLGLAIVWGTVKDHKGYIDVQTEMGQGTTFTLYFPVTRDEMTAPQQKKWMEEYMGHGETVLVVDDIAEQREVASALLQKLGYKVRAVASGEEAVESLRQHQADLIVLDMIMVPGIDGLETYQRILEINPKQKAVIVSGFSETERVKEAQNLGAGAYIKKPYVMETLGMAIRNELQR